MRLGIWLSTIVLISATVFCFSYKADAVIVICDRDTGGAAGCSGNYGGYADTGTAPDSSASGNNGHIAVTKVTLDCTGTSTSMSVYTDAIANASREIKAIVYADNSGEPGAKLYESDKHNDSDWSTGWKTVEAADYNFSSATTYWVGFAFESNSNKWYYESGASANSRHYSTGGVFASLPDPWPAGSDTNISQDGAIYVTF